MRDLVERCEADLRTLAGARLFVTGGTGFVGTWLLETLAAADRALALRLRVTVLARDPAGLARSASHRGGDARFEIVRGDVRALPAHLGVFDGIVHAATPASAALNAEQPLLMLDTIVAGGRAVLELARTSGAIPVLFTSSGAVYGPQPATLSRLAETYGGGPDPLSPAHAYHEGKRIGELQCALYAAAHGVRAKIARLFAFVGPHLPLDRHFAVGNFIRDALAARPIVVAGDGTAVRTYLYGADMVAYLLAIFVRGATGRAYNVGSERPVTVADLARTVAGRVDPAPNVVVRGTPDAGRAIDRYVPDTARIRGELGACETVSLAEGIDRTLAFHRARGA